jgi:hypothetical protein
MTCSYVLELSEVQRRACARSLAFLGENPRAGPILAVQL